MPLKLLDLQSACLNGGYIVSVRSETMALQAQNRGAIGVLIKPPDPNTADEVFNSIIRSISIHPLCYSSDKELFKKCYRQQFEDTGPGYFIYFETDRSDQPTEPRSIVSVMGIDEFHAEVLPEDAAV